MSAEGTVQGDNASQLDVDLEDADLLHQHTQMGVADMAVLQDVIEEVDALLHIFFSLLHRFVHVTKLFNLFGQLRDIGFTSGQHLDVDLMADQGSDIKLILQDPLDGGVLL